MGLRRIGILLLAAGLAACRRETTGGSAVAVAKTAHPNRDVVLITIDTLRSDAVGFDGNPRGTTPNLDRFAAEGRVFTEAHSHNVITLPSHTNILTGLYPYQHGVRENLGFRLSPKIDTVATRLKARGFATGAFVGAFILDSRYGLARGFDVYDELYRHLDEPLEFDIQQARAEAVVQAALAWFRGQPAGHRFLWVHVYDPHAPYEPPEEYQKRFADDLYLGEVAYTDASLAPLLEEVRKAQPAPLLIVTGDHGEARGDHGELTHGLFCYEATIHVPLMTWCPGLIPPGRDAILARHVDIVPTILDALGIEKPKELTGASLLGPRTAEAPDGSYFEALSAAFNRGWAPLRGLMSAGQKYIDLPIQELYDVPKDPREVDNLVESRPDPLRRLRKRLLELPEAPIERGTIGSEEAAKLKSLGYLAGSEKIKPHYGPSEDPKTLIGVDQKLHEIIALYEQHKFDEAIPVARRVVAENPKMGMGYVQLAVVLQAKGDLKSALQVYESAVTNGASGESMERRRGLLLCEMGLPKKAVEVLSPFRESDDIDTLNALGVAIADAGRPEEALHVFSRVLELDPGDARALQDTGMALLKLDRPEEARRYLEQALERGRRQVRAWNALGVAWMQLGNPAKAIEAWEQCLELNPEQYDALYNIGRVAGQMRDWKKARTALEKFVATAPPRQYGKDIAEVRAVLADMKRQGI